MRLAILRSHTTIIMSTVLLHPDHTCYRRRCASHHFPHISTNVEVVSPLHLHSIDHPVRIYSTPKQFHPFPLAPPHMIDHIDSNNQSKDEAHHECRYYAHLFLHALRIVFQSFLLTSFPPTSVSLYSPPMKTHLPLMISSIYQ